MRSLFRVFAILICLFLIFNIATLEDDHEEEEEGTARSFISFSEMVASLYTSFPTRSRSYWNKIKSLINQAPHLDFRGSDEEDGRGKGGVTGGGGEKVKEAVTKSWKKGKETMEDTARSAAIFATEAVHKTKEAVVNKQALGSHKEHESDNHRQNEL